MRSSLRLKADSSSIGPKSRLQLIDKLTKFQNAVDRREIHRSFTSRITRHYNHTNISVSKTRFRVRTDSRFLQLDYGISKPFHLQATAVSV